MHRKTTLLFFVTALSAPAPAYELAVFSSLGFSDDGSHFAWEQYGTQDPTGFAYSEIEIVSVPDGQIAYRCVYMVDMDEIGEEAAMEAESLWLVANPGMHGFLCWEEEARRNALEEARSALVSFGIDGRNTGRLCVHHPLTDMTETAGPVRFATGMWGDGHAASPVFDLILENVPADWVDEGIFLSWIVPPQVLRLHLNSVADDSVTVLADDAARLDGSNLCYWYSIRDVITWQDRYVVVVLRKSMPGFEGPDIRYRVVTGVLPDFPPVWSCSSKG